MDWLKKAVDQGFPSAIQAYASIHNGADKVEKNPAITAAYFSIFLSRNGGSPKQRAWLEDFMTELDQPTQDEVARIISNYRANPTELTRKARSGIRAAQALTGS